MQSRYTYTKRVDSWSRVEALNSFEHTDKDSAEAEAVRRRIEEEGLAVVG